MPLYEFVCHHQTWEVYYPKYLEDNVERQVMQCGCNAKRITSLCSMQPDTMWSGVVTQQGYFTSKESYLNNLRARGIEQLSGRADFEATRKRVKNIRADKKKKQKESLKNFLTEELKGVTIDPDGNTVKERNTYVSKRQ